MEPQCPSVAKHTDYSNSAVRWFLHHKQSQEHSNNDDRYKFWESRWSSDMKDWTAFNKKAQVMEQNLVQSCDSPLASDSSSSLSTWESSHFSWNSENSYTAGSHVLQSPELLSSRFFGFSLFNSGINHLEAISKEKDATGNIIISNEQQEQFCLQKQGLPQELVKFKQSTVDATNQCSRPLDSEFHTAEMIAEKFSTSAFAQTNTTMSYLDDGWVSDSSDSESWASTPSQELTKNNPLEKANDMHLGRPCIGSEEISADALTHSNFMSAEKLCCAAPHKSCRLIFAPETYQMHLIEDFEPLAHNSEIEILNERHVSDECCKGHGLYELLEHERNECKLAKIAQYYSASVDREAKLQLPTSPNTLVPTSLQSGDKTRPSICTKSRLSAAVKERHASSTLHGYLRFAEQGGSLCYSFFVDDSDEVLFARACREERQSNKENCDWSYTFHSKKENGKAKGAWKSWPKKERLASDLVANMKVPGVCKSKKNQDGHVKEARFVLYDGRGQQHVQSPAIGDEKLQCQPLKSVLHNTVASQVGYAQTRVKYCSMNFHANKTGPFDGASNNSLKNGSCQLGNVKNASGSKDFCAERLKTCIINQQAELAAIVISTSVKEKKRTRRKESKPPLTDSAGWGVKFLDKGSGSGWGLSFMEKPSGNPSGSEEMRSCTVPNGGGPECIGAQTTRGMYQSYMAQLPNDKDSQTRTCPDLAQKPEKRSSHRKSRLKVDVTVILPAGDHGLPTEDEEDVDGGDYSQGPTPLLERWVSGGECKCGGWDMGCGLSVFKAETLSLHKRTANIALTRHDRMNWLSPGNSFKVFTQGYKQKKVLVLEIIEAGLFSLSFQARFSPLQAFSIAVALFHQQMTHK